jgi:hypothetical protein
MYKRKIETSWIEKKLVSIEFLISEIGDDIDLYATLVSGIQFDKPSIALADAFQLNHIS